MTAIKDRPAAIPDFEGTDVTGSAVRVTNAGDGLSDAMTIGKKALHMDQEVFYVLRGTVTQVNHKADKDGDLTRVHTVRADAITEVDGELAGKLLSEAALALQQAKDQISGQLALDSEHQAEAAEALDATGSPEQVAAAAKARAGVPDPFKKPVE